MFPPSNWVKLPPLKGLGLPMSGNVAAHSREPLKVDTFANFVTRSKDSQPSQSALLSPPASIHSPMPPTWNEPYVSNRISSKRTATQEVAVAAENSYHSFTVPDYASTAAGGWFDPDNWLFKHAVDEYGGLDIGQLLHVLYKRGDRPQYGEDHVSTRAKKGGHDIDDGNDDVYTRSNTKPHDHKTQEKERRDRHRVLSKEVDECTGDAVVELSERKLPEIKNEIALMPKPNPSSGQGAKSNKTGKDKQLMAAAFLPHLSNIVIFRLLEAHNELENELASAQQVQTQLENEVRRKSELMQARANLIDGLYSRPSSIISLPPTLQQPRGVTRKRKAFDIDDASCSSTSPKRHDNGTQKQPQRFPHLLGAPKHQFSSRLPLSPSPDLDDRVMSSFSSCS
ncbi:hypothetical protein LTR64_008255 [Lithohypha guttulata]|uniref:uncharacterized protein n=1 Tax=Lithohypha guttulata TaxID=1690604 RepID=UPI002DDE84E2|nr:hypothetical protein LTR51_008407 [Lithohypha guttulata]